MVPDTPDVEQVLFGAGGVAEGLSKSKIVVDMSSSAPAGTLELAKDLETLGLVLIDAPVSMATPDGAWSRGLTLMVGGNDEAALEECQNLLGPLRDAWLSIAPAATPEGQ